MEVIGQTRLYSKGSKQRRKHDFKPSHPATRTFQALRIAVNDELGAVQSAIPAAIECLRPGGRLAVITFHSLEDRIVKWAMRDAARQAGPQGSVPEDLLPELQHLAQGDGIGDTASVKLVTRKPTVPSAEELEQNVRARTAKLRVVQKL